MITELKMLTTVPGSRDGRVTERFVAGTTYQFKSDAREQELAQTFLRERWAELPPAVEVKVPTPVPDDAELKRLKAHGTPVPLSSLPPDLQRHAALTPEEREFAAKHPVIRLPLLDEYLKAGYLEENYQKMIEQQTAEATRLGQRIEIRALTAEELEAERLERTKLESKPSVVTKPDGPKAKHRNK